MHEWSASDVEWRTDSILPSPPEGAIPVLHDREYRIESFLLDNGNLLIHGALRDQKPPGLFVPGDPEPLTMHHMQVGLEISLPDRTIVAVQTHFAAYPHGGCPAIIDHYERLVGLSIARGFTHEVRRLFGGPRGCAHTTALLQAMAPIAMQSSKSIEAIQAQRVGAPNPIVTRPAGQGTSWEYLLNTCHVWAEGGERHSVIDEGGMQTIPVDVRLRELGVDPAAR